MVRKDECTYTNAQLHCSVLVLLCALPLAPSHLTHPRSLSLPTLPTFTPVQHTTLPSISPQEVAVERAFARYDTDGNKCIDRTELASLCQQLGAPLTEVELGEAIQELDTDHSGMIEKGEFLTWWLDRDRKGANTGLRKKLSKVALTGARGGEWRSGGIARCSCGGEGMPSFRVLAINPCRGTGGVGGGGNNRRAPSPPLTPPPPTPPVRECTPSMCSSAKEGKK